MRRFLGMVLAVEVSGNDKVQRPAIDSYSSSIQRYVLLLDFLLGQWNVIKLDGSPSLLYWP